jgi:S-DNA-T family DNA segregation ATPase FtsK/SpoIIIE
MFFKRKKKISPYVVEERTQDIRPFEVPRILDELEKKKYHKDPFVSPIFGSNVPDRTVIPNPVFRQGDLDLQYDGFRTKPKLSKEDYKEKYGSEYPEFDLIKGKNLKEAIEHQELRGQKETTQESFSFEEQGIETKSGVVAENKVEKVLDHPNISSEKSGPKTHINDFFKEPIKRREEIKPPQAKNKYNAEYRLPSINLLNRPQVKVKDNYEWVQKQIDILNKTFKEFGVGARVKQFTKGPTVTRYEIELESGVYVKKVTGITDNIKMALAAKEIRIEAPIPGKSTVGIEVPNEVPEIVHFVDIVKTDEFKNSEDPLTIALGLDIDGNGVYTSISKMPHGLVAGATGSGKSVCINTVLMSLLFKYSPDELKLMLIDPKMVELSSYNDLPHLITPVITDSKIATAGLKWAVEEMERRFIVFSNERVRDIKSYNSKALTNDLDYMPYIVIIVDELADLMMVASSSVEEAIMRLTQKARACGIHLIIATQRPSTDVIKGTIKSNIPTRIAFMVSSYIDSMTIIDSAGADKLLGRGDMLFALSGKPQVRVQGAFISDDEIYNVNEYIRRQRSNEYMFTQEKLVKRATSVKNSDEYLEDVAIYVVNSQQASINKISKEFKIGFNRAQKIVETLYEMGVVSDNVGSKARTVLVSLQELQQILEES